MLCLLILILKVISCKFWNLYRSFVVSTCLLMHISGKVIPIFAYISEQRRWNLLSDDDERFPLGFGEIVQPQIIITSETYSSSSKVRGATGALQGRRRRIMTRIWSDGSPAVYNCCHQLRASAGCGCCYRFNDLLSLLSVTAIHQLYQIESIIR